jgi:translation initiation factor IF-2
MSNLDMLMSRIKAGSLKNLKVLVKADSNWSLEAIKAYITKLSTAETNVMIIYAWVGNVTESDIAMAEWSKAILVWFNVWETSTAKKIIDKADIEYMNSKIIYHITERLEKIVTWMLDPKEETIVLWEAKVWWIFFTWKWFMILWLILQPENKIEVNAEVNIVRKGKLIWKWKIKNLKSWTIDVKELEWPIECWIELETDAELEMKDTLEIFKVVIVK